MSKQDVDALINSLQIVDENVCAEAVKQPLLFVEAARYRVSKMRGRAMADAALDELTSRLSLMHRARATDKPTNDHIKALVQKNPKWKVARDRLQRAEESEEFSKLLLEAFRSRDRALKIIADAHWYEGAKESSAFEREQQNTRLRTEVRTLQARKRHAE